MPINISNFENWLRTYRSQKTAHAYKGSLSLFQRLVGGDRPVNKDTANEFVQLLLKRGIAASSVNRHLAALKSYLVFSDAHDEARRIPLLKAFRKEAKFWTKLQVREFMTRCLTSFDKALFYLTYCAALRISEASAVNLDDIEFDRCRVRIKTKKQRGGNEYDYAVLDRRTLDALGEYIRYRKSECKALFTMNGTGRTNVDTLRRHFKSIMDQAKLEGTFHILRHSRAYEYVTSKPTPSTIAIMKLLRHRSLTSTERYVHWLHTDSEAAMIPMGW